MRVFLTGGTGFIGQHLVQSLLQRGWEVTALVRRPESVEARAIGQLGADLNQGDVTNRESMRAGMTGADIVVHNAGAYEYGVNAKARESMTAINVQGTQNVLGLAQELAVPRTVYVSTTWAYGASGLEPHDETFVRQNSDYFSHYEGSKHEAHGIALKYIQQGLPLMIVCPNGVVGPNDHSVLGYLLRLYLNGWLPPMAWAPESIFTLVDVHDLSEGIALTAEKGRLGETYFLCGEAGSTRQMLEVWATQPGGFKGRVWLPTGLTKIMFASLEPLLRSARLPAFLSRETVTATSVSMNYSNAKAKRELGWTHRSRRDMWLETITAERTLIQKRSRRDMVSRLKPVVGI
jgi:dihydroflavonol-4-reductase